MARSRRAVRRRRQVFWLSTAAVVLALAAATFVAWQDGMHARMVSAGLRDWAGIDARFRGELALRFEPDIGVVATDVVLSGGGSNAWRVQIGHFELSVDQARLFGRELIIKRFYARDLDGEIRIGPADKVGAMEPFTVPIFEELQIEKAHIRLVNGRTGSEESVVIEALTAHSDEAQGSILVDGRGTFEGEAVKIRGQTGSVAMAASPIPYPVDLEVHSAGLVATLRGTILDALGQQQVDLALDVDVADPASAPIFAGLPFMPSAVVKLNGRIGGRLSAPNLENLRFSMTGPNGRVSAEGRIGDLRGLDDFVLQIDVAVTPQQPPLALPDALTALRPREINGTARLSGNVDDLLISKSDLQVDTVDGARLSVRGGMRLVSDNGNWTYHSVAADVALSAPAAGVLPTALAEVLPAIGPVSGAARLYSKGETLRVSNIRLLLGAGSPLELTITGEAAGLIETSNWLPETSDIRIRLSADDTSSLAVLVGGQIPSLGPMTADWSLNIADDGKLGFNDIKGSLGRQGALQAEVAGHIKRFARAGKSMFTGVDLAVQLSAPSLHDLPNLARHGLPDLGPLRGSLRLLGNGNALRVSDIDMVTGIDGPVRLGLKGTIETLGLAEGSATRARDLRIEITATDTSHLSPHVGWQIPAFGPVTGTARLALDGTDLAISDVKLAAQSEAGDQVTVTGQIGDALALGDAALKVSLGASVDTLLQLAYGAVEPLGLGRLEGSLELRIQPQAVVTRKIDLVWHKGSAVRLRGAGTAVLDGEGTTGRFELTAETSAVAALAGEFGLQRLHDSPARVAGTLDMDSGGFRIEGAGRLGGKKFSLKVAVAGGDIRPLVTGEINFDAVTLDLIQADGVSPDAAQDASGEAVNATASASGSLFPDQPIALSLLRAVDIDLRYGAGKITAAEHEVRNLDVGILLKNGSLKLDPYSFEYVGGRSELAVEFDATRHPPAFSARMKSNDLATDLLLNRFGTDKILEGDLSIDLELAGKGRSVREIAHSLVGHVGLALENGRLTGHDLSLMAPNIGNWLLTLPQNKGETELRCVLARFDVEAGVATNNSLLLMTPETNIGGTAKIDLPAETMDIVLRPERGGNIPSFSNPVRIHGPIRNPDVVVNYTGIAGNAAVATGGIVLLPFVYLPWQAAGYMLGMLKEEGDSPCLPRAASK